MYFSNIVRDKFSKDKNKIIDEIEGFNNKKR